MKRAYLLASVFAFCVAISGCGGKNGGGVSNPAGGGSEGTGGSSGSSGSGSTGSSGTTDSGGSYAAREPSPGGNYLDIDSFPMNDIVNGGVNKDQIPALDQPRFVHPSSPEAFYLRPDDLVMGVVINGEAKAYPHNMGWWHEVINDNVGGQPVIVTFCPLTGTGMVFDGRLDNGDWLTMGVSGLLFNNNLIMFSKLDDTSLYPQMIGRAVSGPARGEELKLLPVVETTWDYWRALYPSSKVISAATGVYEPTRYTLYPYRDQGDYRQESNYILYPMAPASVVTPYFGAKQVTLGVRFGEIAKAYPFPAMGSEAVVNDVIREGANTHNVVVVFYELHKLALPYSRDVVVNGEIRTLTFDQAPSTNPVFPFFLKDRETGSLWTLKGDAINGPLAGQKLVQIPAHNGFWFAWTTFWRNTGIY